MYSIVFNSVWIGTWALHTTFYHAGGILWRQQAKKREPTPGPTLATAMCAAPQNGAGGLQEHARFFDHLVELVPAKHYYDDEHQHLNTRFLAKAAREAAKEEMKAQYKLNKRTKLDPDQAVTALDLQRRKTQAAGTSGRAGEQEGPSTSQPAAPGKGQQQRQEQGAGLKLQLSGASLSRQELLERLHKKIEVGAEGGGKKPQAPPQA